MILISIPKKTVTDNNVELNFFNGLNTFYMSLRACGSQHNESLRGGRDIKHFCNINHKISSHWTMLNTQNNSGLETHFPLLWGRVGWKERHIKRDHIFHVYSCASQSIPVNKAKIESEENKFKKKSLVSFAAQSLNLPIRFPSIWRLRPLTMLTTSKWPQNIISG